MGFNWGIEVLRYLGMRIKSKGDVFVWFFVYFERRRSAIYIYV